MVHWQLEWRTPLNMKYVVFAKKILRGFFNDNNKSNETTIDRAIKHDNDYLLKNIVTINAVEKAVFYKDDSLVKVGYSYYPLIFSMPRSCIVRDETKELDFPTDIIINEWAYQNCYMKSINRILEDWGKVIYGLLYCHESESMLKYSCYYGIIQKIVIRKGLEKYNENNKDNSKEQKMEPIHKSDNNNVEIIRKEKETKWTSFSEGTLYIFYTDGKGNLYGKKKRSATGHFSILLDNTKEKWKHKDPEITSNVAEIKGVLGAMMISVERDYKNVEIRTDSQGVLKWINGTDLNIETNIKEEWQANQANIKYYIKKLVLYGKKIPHLKLSWIKRTQNKAHAI